MWIVNTSGQSILHVDEHVDSKYKWSVNISTSMATIYLNGLLIRKILVASLKWGLKIIEN
jgi:hypothetical protein